jgi:hypothetical protein
MGALQTCKTILSYVKNSKLNWNLVESPFLVTINLKIKCLTKKVKKCGAINMSTLKYWLCHISSYKYRIFKQFVSTPHNYPLIMGGRDKKYEDLMLSARDITWAIFQSRHFYCSTLYKRGKRLFSPNIYYWLANDCKWQNLNSTQDLKNLKDKISNTSRYKQRHEFEIHNIIY